VTIGLFVVLSNATTSCREPTSVLIEARTNVPYRAGIVTTFTVGSRPADVENAEPTTESRDVWDNNETIGTLVVVPETSDDASVSIKLVMGVNKDPRACSSASPDGCIFARRRLRYTPNQQLRLPIALYARCEGVPCDADSTCNYLGTCVSSEIDPSTCGSAAGCSPKDDAAGQLPDAAGGASPDGATDGALDSGDAAAARDGVAPSDAASMVDGESDIDSGQPLGTVDCRTALCGAGQSCCYNQGSSTGVCVPGNNCVGQATTVRCDGDEDCLGEGTSCCALNPLFLICMARTTCLANGGLLVCHSTNTCPLTVPPQSCTAITAGYYRTCID